MENKDTPNFKRSIDIVKGMYAMAQANSYKIDGEEIQGLLPAGVDPYSDMKLVLGMVKGKEIKAQVKTERYEQLNVRGIILGAKEDMPGAVDLWVEDWKGRVLPEPWAIKVLEVLG